MNAGEALMAWVTSECACGSRVLTGQYGVRDLYVGVPVVIGAGGIERIVEITLDPAEKAAFDKSCAAVRDLVDIASKMRQTAAAAQ